MKKGIHPTYYEDSKITCSCGAVLTTGATKKEMSVEICSQCHPFYTGKKKVLDSTGRVDRFKKIAERSAAKKEAVKKAKTVKKPARNASGIADAGGEKVEKKDVKKK